MSDSVQEILEALRGTEPDPAAVRAAADRIAAHGEAALPALMAALADADEDEAILAVTAAALRRLAAPGVARRLVPLLGSPRLGDLAKALLLGVLEDAGMDIHDPSLVGAVVDLEGGVWGGTTEACPSGNGSGRSGEAPGPPSGEGS